MKQNFRRFILAATLLTGLLSISAAAQSPASSYTVHLARTTQWGPATLAPGTYRVTSRIPYMVVTIQGTGIRLANGTHPELIYLAARSMRSLGGSSMSTAVILNHLGASLQVASMRFGDSGVELQFLPPAPMAPPSAQLTAGR